MGPDCIFCGIVTERVRGDILASSEEGIVIRDINPQAPVHLLVISKRHVPDAASLAGENPELLGDLMALATQAATTQGLDNGYRLVVNTGPDGGQTVSHLHVHVLGGRHMTWPPG